MTNVPSETKLQRERGIDHDTTLHGYRSQSKDKTSHIPKYGSFLMFKGAFSWFRMGIDKSGKME